MAAVALRFLLAGLSLGGQRLRCRFSCAILDAILDGPSICRCHHEVSPASIRRLDVFRAGISRAIAITLRLMQSRLQSALSSQLGIWGFHAEGLYEAI
jgi:hypothetical protein